MKKMMTAALAACLAASLAGCTGAQAQNGESAADEATERTSQAGSSDMTAALEGLDLDFSKRDTDPSYDEAAATKVSLADDAISVDGSGAEAEGSQLTVTAAGTYVVTGELGNGGITVAAGDEDKVQLVLSNTVIHNENGPAIFVDNADKVFITLAEGTENSLTDGAEYQLTDEDDNRDACVFSRETSRSTARASSRSTERTSTPSAPRMTWSSPEGSSISLALRMPSRARMP